MKEVQIVPDRVGWDQRRANMLMWARMYPRDKLLVDETGGYVKEEIARRAKVARMKEVVEWDSDVDGSV